MQSQKDKWGTLVEFTQEGIRLQYSSEPRSLDLTHSAAQEQRPCKEESAMENLA